MFHSRTSFAWAGGAWQPGWAAEVKERTSGKTSGGVDVVSSTGVGKDHNYLQGWALEQCPTPSITQLLS